MPNNGSSDQRENSLSPSVILILAIVIDLIGYVSYLVPVIGESIDVIWAPIQAFMLHKMYGSYAISILGFLEEILPGLDFVPTACIGWYMIHGPKKNND
jgi:hypothetical protein